MDKVRCQSCAMPMGPDYFGKEADGKDSAEYCRFCYQNGAFTNPTMTQQEMIDSSVRFMTTSLGFAEDKARTMSEQMIPSLKRWKK